MKFRSAELLVLSIFVAFVLSYSITPAYAAEPSLEDILNNLGFTNITVSTVETFPACSYEIILYAEFAGYHSTNELSYYPVGTSDFSLIFSGPEGNNGYISPPLNKTFSCNTTFGISMYVGAEDHRYFTENTLNPDGQNHSKVYLNLDNPDMYLIGFENVYGMGDRDYNDMVFSLEKIEYYLDVGTEPPGITVINGTGWYCEGENVTLTAPEIVPISNCLQYNFSHWDVDDISQGDGVDQITIFMGDNHTATANYTPQYYLTVTSPYGTPTGQGWYDNGTIAYAGLDTGTVLHGNDTKRIFTHWGGDATGTDYSQSDPITMDDCKTALANWKTQYYLTVSSLHGTPSGGGWYDSGDTAYASVSPLTVAGPPGTQFVFTHWSIDASGTTSPSDPITMNGPKTAVANWKTQYYLTLTWTDEGYLNSSSQYYDEGTNVCVKATPHPGYSLGHWELDVQDVGKENPYCVAMNAPHTLHAVFEYVAGGSAFSIEVSELPVWIGVNVMLISAIFVASAAFRRGRRRI